MTDRIGEATDALIRRCRRQALTGREELLDLAELLDARREHAGDKAAKPSNRDYWQGMRDGIADAPERIRRALGADK